MVTISSTSGWAARRCSAPRPKRPWVQATRTWPTPRRAQVLQQFDHRRAGGDLVVEDDHVLAGGLADDGADRDLGRREMRCLAADRDRQPEPPREGRRLLGVAHVRRDHDGVGEVVAGGSGRRVRAGRAGGRPGTLKKPCTCGACSAMVSTRPAPAVASRSATSRPPIEMRGASFLSERA